MTEVKDNPRAFAYHGGGIPKETTGMAKRKIISIDRDLCDGCGRCTTACAEGALELDAEGKAVLVRELYCDGMGACLDVCPTGALTITERDSEGYDPREAYDHVLRTRGRDAAGRVHGAGIHEEKDGDGAGSERPKQSKVGPGDAGRSRVQAGCGGGCPGSAAREIAVEAEEPAGGRMEAKSQLSQWPVQLHLVSPFAPYFKNADLLVAADCTAFALGSFHATLLRGRRLVIACPKLDETSGYLEKLAEIIRLNELRSLTVAVMTVPCCAGLVRLVEQAVRLAGSPLEVKRVVVGIDGAAIG